eukprot:CAMPEP_0115852768 /NCGR_PEP_ID=MMETSP0287-20121206/13164_1 /TAXON_ID=412157 /ORGANISM="Chrysochromulina rotalis, Strain UIO044" /LENGTH=486 /DNA_ID=CAMNT_0003306835 /DNA_START=100 /DNA_END=1557 /DNA_ORIENTATION=+
MRSGLSSNARNARQSTPLHIACVKGHEDVAITLLDHGADANAVNEEGNSPLHAAVEMGQIECAKLLLARGAKAELQANNGIRPLRIAAMKGDAAMLSAFSDVGLHIDEEAAQDAFWAAVQLTESNEGESISAAVPQLLHHVFDADFRHLLNRGKQATNVTCMQPSKEGSGYDVTNDDLVQVSLTEGRVCDGGSCCEDCSRVFFPEFTTQPEVASFLEELEFAVVPLLRDDDTNAKHQFSLQKSAFRDQRTTLIFVRIVERMRRAIAHEYGLPLSTVTPLQCFVSFFEGAQAKQGGLHSDESTHKEFHYSCVAYLSTQHEDFEGGSFNWNDPVAGGSGERQLTPLSPTKGSAVIFSSGWENMHEVEPLESGTRFAMPCFFTTCPVPKDVQAPTNVQECADKLWQTLLAPQDVADYRQFLQQWHELLAPDAEHVRCEETMAHRRNEAGTALYYSRVISVLYSGSETRAVEREQKCLGGGARLSMRPKA